MNLRPIFLFVSVVATCALLAACASSGVKPANPATVSKISSAKKSGKAVLVVYRPRNSLGGLLSPSAGVIVDAFEPVDLAKNYERAGANAISVLTDSKFFQGSLVHLRNVRDAVSLPLLRKDFIWDRAQIAESAANGADAILLIVAALTQDQLVRLLKGAKEFRLDALVEVHSVDELQRALEAGAEIVGINNRDLTTFDVDLTVTERLCRDIPDEIILVSESGIKTAQDTARMKACGVDAVLVGEALMRGDVSIEQLRAVV